MGPNPGIMMKKVLIVSPHFPPVNAADMHRVRQSLPYFREMGWDPVVITVDEAYIESYSRDPLLSYTIPSDIVIHRIKAFDVRWTRKLGLGSLSMRSYYFFKKKGDELLKRERFDLVYFSTTAFHVMALGPRWKRKFGVPFILDIQDPWRSDFYLDKPKNERPPKFYITYRIDKYLEAATVPKADGIIAVSQGYCDTFMRRYPDMAEARFKVVPFGISPYDFEIMEKYVRRVKRVQLKAGMINVLYIGRGGHDMRYALEIIFKAIAKGVAETPDLFSRLHFWFIGTSYAAPGKGSKTIEPVARSFGVGDQVTEITDRISYFDTLFLLKQADMLLVPGSTDTSYTASKIFPYIMAKRPMVALFYKESSVVDVLKSVRCGRIVAFDHINDRSDSYVDECLSAFRDILGQGRREIVFDNDAFEPHTARAKSMAQVEFFNRIVQNIT
jgi:hypothetical protein